MRLMFGSVIFRILYRSLLRRSLFTLDGRALTCEGPAMTTAMTLLLLRHEQARFQRSIVTCRVDVRLSAPRRRLRAVTQPQMPTRKHTAQRQYAQLRYQEAGFPKAPPRSRTPRHLPTAEPDYHIKHIACHCIFMLGRFRSMKCYGRSLFHREDDVI